MTKSCWPAAMGASLKNSAAGSAAEASACCRKLNSTCLNAPSRTPPLLKTPSPKPATPPNTAAGRHWRMIRASAPMRWAARPAFTLPALPAAHPNPMPPTTPKCQPSWRIKPTNAAITCACWCWCATKTTRSRLSPRAFGAANGRPKRPAATALATTRISTCPSKVAPPPSCCPK